MVPVGRAGEYGGRPIGVSNRSGEGQTSIIRVPRVRTCNSGKDKVIGGSLAQLALIAAAA
jgi:hypothetical protein